MPLVSATLTVAEWRAWDQQHNVRGKSLSRRSRRALAADLCAFLGKPARLCSLRDAIEDRNINKIFLYVTQDRSGRVEDACYPFRALDPT